MNNIDLLIEKALCGEKIAVSRLISLIEHGDEKAQTILEAIYPHCGNALYLGITGPPGAGKSTLVDKLVGQFCNHNFSVAVIAVDPCSPFSGGAFLGDRIRMHYKREARDCFFRSMSAGKVVGGLAQKTKEASWVLDASGRDVIIIETVGVGQSELDVMMATDITVVVLTPESGDHIQIMKAGLIEIADVFAVNKSDLTGAKHIVNSIHDMLDRKEMVLGKMSWRPIVVRTSAVRNSGITELYEQITSCHASIKKTGALDVRRELQYENDLLKGIEEEIKRIAMGQNLNNQQLPEFSKNMRKQKKDPQSAARLFLRKKIQISPQEKKA